MDETGSSALDQVLELTVLLHTDMTDSLARHGLTVSRAHLLWVLHQHGPSTQRVLAESLGVSARNITGLVDGLVRTGFVTREQHPTDRRATLVSFTGHGASVTGEMERGQQELARLLFAGLPADRYECFVAGLGDVLNRLRDRLQENREQTGG